MRNTRPIALAFAAGFALTLLGLLLLAVVYFTRGDRGLEFLLPRGAWTYSPLILLTAAIAWVLAGCALLIAWRQPPPRADLLFFIGFLLLAFLYLNLLREREHFYDLNDYLVAARSLHDHLPLPPRYLYPPLWALTLAPLIPLGDPALTALLVAANFAALLLFYYLLWRALRRGGFTSPAAALAALALLAVNVPLQRTLFYGQINLHVANLILLALLWSDRRPALSAAALALAAHLKILPVLFILPFLFRRDGRWLAWFAAAALGLGALTLWAGGPAVYGDFLANTRAALAAPTDTNFRDNSIDSFLRATAYVLRHLAHVAIPAAALTVLILTLKALIFAGALFLLGARTPSSAPPNSECGLMNEENSEREGPQRSAKDRKEHKNNHAEEAYYDSFVVVSFLMLLLSPVLWEHYPVFLIFPLLALLRSLDGAAGLIAWLAAWFLIFCVPTFDFYPFSYTRLAGIVLCLPLLVRFTRCGANPGPVLSFLNSNAECGMKK